MKFDRITISLLFIDFIKSTQYTSMAPLIPMVFTQRSIALHWAGVNLFVYMLMLAFMSILSGYKMQTFGAKKLFWFSYTALALYPLIIISANHLIENNAIFVGVCTFAQLVGGSGSAVKQTVGSSILYLLNPKSRPIVSAAIGLASCLGFMVGFGGGKALYDLGGFSMPFLVTFFALLLTLPFLNGFSTLINGLYDCN